MSAEHLEVRWRRPEELDARELQAWTGLESRAAEPNVYLSPHFVLPALRHLDASLRPVIAWIEAGTGAARELVGVQDAWWLAEALTAFYSGAAT